MKRVTLFCTLIVVAVGLVGVLATNVYAFPGSTTTPCVQACHHTVAPVGDPSLIPPLVPGGTVIDTSTPDTTMPVTTCLAPDSFRGNAYVRMTASDAGWGMGYLYYSLDGRFTHMIRVPANLGSIEVTLPLIPAPATGSAVHTLSYWSQDNYGNVARVATDTFTVSARTRMAMPIAANHSWVYRSRPVTLSGTVFAPGMKVVLYVKKSNSRVYTVLRTLTASDAKAWTYTYRPSMRGYYYFKVAFAGDAEWLASGSVYKRVLVK